jgi:hypothetical protein
MLKERIAQLTSELGLEMPKADQQKTFTLTINPDVSLHLHELAPGFACQANLGPCPQKKREELFLYLMRANFLGQGTGGARLGLDADEKTLTLSSGFSYEMNYQAFKESIEDFVNYLMYWREAVAKFERET